jgi:nucleoid-associated protein YgaU
MKMIRRAVEQRPDDGYIVDSLGWAYYRVGNYEDATKHLERAVELRPDDATINDHLGDVYWAVGRKREAYFQWAHARDSNPEKEDLPKILHKLQHGLDDAALLTPVGPDGNKVTVGRGESLWTIAARLFGNGEHYIRILEANREQLGGDPNRIYPGMTLDVPAGVN